MTEPKDDLLEVRAAIEERGKLDWYEPRRHELEAALAEAADGLVAEIDYLRLVVENVRALDQTGAAYVAQAEEEARRAAAG